ncbi:tail-associated lysozyme [Ochrobactrum phage vB_OspM_OC]|nr:tail-associated lysozyme [Ochrobactrum phage vB_OspM_OC]
MALVSVKGDPNTDGNGALLADTQTKVKIGGLLIVCVTSNASADNLCPIVGGEHCNPKAVTGSANVKIGGLSIHRHGDGRSCGASTIVTGQTKVKIG